MENILMTFVCGVLTVLFPILMLPLNLFLFFVNKNNKKIYAFLVAICLGCIAYVWNPARTYDLYRWHLEVKAFSELNFSQYINIVIQNYEPVNYAFKFIISKIGNVDLLQFTVTTIGYFELLWMVSDYSINKKTTVFGLFITTITLLVSLSYINFISGLWYNFAIINFALGFYLSTKGTRIIHWLFYLIAIGLHISTTLLLLLLILCKIRKKEITKLQIILIFSVFSFLGNIIVFLNNSFNNQFFSYIYRLYWLYFENGSRFSSLHSDSLLYVTLIKLFFCLLLFIFSSKEKYSVIYRNYSIVSLVVILAQIINARVFMRFSYFEQMLLIPMMIDYFGEMKHKKELPIMLGLVVGIIVLSSYQAIVAINNSGIIYDISKNIFNSIFSLK